MIVEILLAVEINNSAIATMPMGGRLRIQTLAIDVTSAYALLEHLQMIGNNNPNGLFW